jgi:hypothetical protein
VHVENMRAATPDMTSELADHLKRLADDLEEHARQLEARQAAITHRQRQLVAHCAAAGRHEFVQHGTVAGTGLGARVTERHCDEHHRSLHRIEHEHGTR